MCVYECVRVCMNNINANIHHFLMTLFMLVLSHFAKRKKNCKITFSNEMLFFDSRNISRKKCVLGKGTTEQTSETHFKIKSLSLTYYTRNHHETKPHNITSCHIDMRKVDKKSNIVRYKAQYSVLCRIASRSFFFIFLLFLKRHILYNKRVISSLFQENECYTTYFRERSDDHHYKVFIVVTIIIFPLSKNFSSFQMNNVCGEKRTRKEHLPK